MSQVPQPRTHRALLELRGEANPFVHDHVIGEHPVLPTTAAMSWIADTCERLHPGFTFFRVEDFRTLKGIVFDESLANRYVLDLVESARHPEVASFEAKVWHAGPGGRPRHNYSGTFTIRQRIPLPPGYPFRGPFTPLEGPLDCYRNGTLFHGPLLEAVQKVLRLDHAGLVLECRSPFVNEGDQGQFPVRTFNAYTADVQFQAAAIWARYAYDSAGLPLRIGTVEQFRPVPFEETYYVSLDVKSSDRKHVKTNITQHDEKGAVYTRFIGTELTLSKGLNALFAMGGELHRRPAPTPGPTPGS